MDSFAFQIQLSILGGVGKEKHWKTDVENDNNNSSSADN
jgi:hypothetical protein